MSRPLIVNPYRRAGAKCIYSWKDHKAAGLNGGTDWAGVKATQPGKPALAPATGRATLAHDGLNSVNIQVKGGPIVTTRELASTSGKFPRNVKLNEKIGVLGRAADGVKKAPHLDATVNGVRVPFEQVEYDPQGATRAQATTIAKHHWKTLTGRNPSAVTLARFVPGLMRDRDDTVPIRKAAMSTRAYKKLQKRKQK